MNKVIISENVEKEAEECYLKIASYYDNIE